MLATETDKHYGTGFLAGAFDLFHIGHLNAIRRSKERCDRLIVGVTHDDVIFKNKGKFPVIPIEERLAIVGALRAVDEAVVLPLGRSDKLEILEDHPYDVFFSGDDYAGNPFWAWEEGELNKLGVDLLLFSYTKERTSTGIQREILPPPAKGAGPRKLLDEEGNPAPVAWLFPFDRVEKGSRVVLYGTGRVAGEYLRQIKSFGYCVPVACADKAHAEKPNFGGLPVWAPKELSNRRGEYDKVVLASEKFSGEMAAQLRSLGIEPDKIV